MMEEKVDFDQYVSDYDSILETQHKGFDADISYFASYKVEIAKRIAPNRKKILDFGCGIGRSLPFFAELFSNAQLYGVDQSKESLRIASANNPDVSFGQFEDFSASSVRFDLIFIACVFHHIPPVQRDEVISELKHLLSARGKIVIFEHNPFNPYTLWSVKRCPFDEDAILLKPLELIERFAEQGLSLSEKSFTLFFPGFFAPLRRLEPLLSKLPLGGQYYVVFEKDS